MNLHRCFLTKNECYLMGKKMTPKGVMVHSTAANNPRLSRYVGPDDGLLGKVSSNNWNTFRPGCSVYRKTGDVAYKNGGSAALCAKCPLKKADRGCQQKCVHAFIGELADGTVAAYQTLPWDFIGWHSGSGSKGSANNLGYIGFEICEDGLEDPAYFSLVHREAVELTAYLCKEYGLDPLKDGVVICHAEGHKRGIASNHGDVLHWFPKHGKSMDNFRTAVAETMREGEKIMTYEQWTQYMERYLAQQGELPASDWAVDFVARAKAAGLTDGTRPRALITREEVMTMVGNVAKL